MRLPGWLSGNEPACRCRGHRRYEFDPWVRKIPWRRKEQPTPVFFVGIIPWTEGPSGLKYGVPKSQTRLSMHKKLNEVLALKEFKSRFKSWLFHLLVIDLVLLRLLWELKEIIPKSYLIENLQLNRSFTGSSYITFRVNECKALNFPLSFTTM